MTTKYSAYKSFLGQCNPSDFQVDSPSKPELLIPEQSNLKVRTYYSPFDYINRDARLVIVGITPGREQMNRANQAACLAIQAGMSLEHALLRAKKAASFRGGMQKSLVQLLDFSGFHLRLGIDSCESLWGQNNPLVHFTSTLRNPVFALKDGKEVNYTGGTPPLATYSDFSAQRAQLREELLSINENALILPLGTNVTEAIQAMVDGGELPLSRVLNAAGRVAEFAHPSGENGETVKLSLMHEPMPKAEYCEWMYATYLAKQAKKNAGKSEKKESYLGNRGTRWERDRHTRLALSLL